MKLYGPFASRGCGEIGASLLRLLVDLKLNFWTEDAWKQGTTVLSNDGKEQKMYNIPAFFRHIFERYRGLDGTENDGTVVGRSLFDETFDQETMHSTI